MTYLKYDVAEFRLPTDDNVRNETYSGKMVLVINDTTKAKRDIYNFIYESDTIPYTTIPTETHDQQITKNSAEKNTSKQSETYTKNNLSDNKTAPKNDMYPKS